MGQRWTPAALIAAVKLFGDNREGLLMGDVLSAAGRFQQPQPLAVLTSGLDSDSDRTVVLEAAGRTQPAEEMPGLVRALRRSGQDACVQELLRAVRFRSPEGRTEVIRRLNADGLYEDAKLAEGGTLPLKTVSGHQRWWRRR
ncbi:hypothetical protein [Streptomyces sp. NPDC056647]|uniref:hypothetical protein n=1 Tax=unclassified Streptomyces TaxID=2593676 RepID=UPI0036A0B079